MRKFSAARRRGYETAAEHRAGKACESDSVRPVSSNMREAGGPGWRSPPNPSSAVPVVYGIPQQFKSTSSGRVFAAFSMIPPFRPASEIEAPGVDSEALYLAPISSSGLRRAGQSSLEPKQVPGERVSQLDGLVGKRLNFIEGEHLVHERAQHRRPSRRPGQRPGMVERACEYASLFAPAIPSAVRWPAERGVVLP